MALLAHGLLPASFRGVPFAVSADEIGGGRRIALHQYPGKDEPLAEDMGREARRFHFRGFIVDNDVVFAGGPIQLQRALLLAALEKKGPGTLTHPTLGVLNVAVTRFSVSQDLGAGRMSSVDVEFVESGKKSFASILTQSSGLLSAANLCKVALAIDGVKLIALAVANGGRRSDLSTTAAGWIAKVAELGNDATALYRLTSRLPGNFGRFAGGGNTGLAGLRPTGYSAATTVADLVQIASNARVAIQAAANDLSLAATTEDLGYAAGTAAGATAMVQALADACADPADAIRLIERLIAFTPSGPEPASPIGLALVGMVRRAAAASLAIAASQYQPTSSDDAAAIIREIGSVLDDQATIAADAGDDESYKALRTARGAMVKDLRTRGATLAQIATFRTGRPLPAIVLAQRWYRDPDRAEQLLGQAGSVPHPLFMPTEMRALAQ